MSIKPKYAQPILDRTKTFEFRKSIFARSDIDKIVIYSSSPRMRIVGYFKFKKILKENPKTLWAFQEKVEIIKIPDLILIIDKKKHPMGCWVIDR